MRNSPDGMIWQAYTFQNEQEQRILTKNANKNGFIVQVEPDGYTEETSPGWRDTEGWAKCLIKDNKLKELKPNRVQLHAATDEWMQGDRYGSIQARRENGEVLVRLDKSNKLKWFAAKDIFEEFVTI